MIFDVYRRVMVKRFPYMAVYRVANRRVEVLAIVGTPRDPATVAAMVAERAGE